MSQAKREEHLAQYQQVVALREQGFSQTAIAAQVGVGHATVSRWLSHGTFPEQKSPQCRTRFDPHLKEVAERWNAGCHNIAQLHRELVAAGHTITYRNVYRQLIRYLPEGRKKSSSDSQLPSATVLARDAVFLLLRRPEELEAEDQETLALLRSLHVEVEHCRQTICCPRCHHVTQVSFPREVEAPVQYGPQIHALPVSLSQFQLLPLPTHL